MYDHRNIDEMSAQTVWPRCPEAAAFLQDTFRAFALANPLVATMADRMRREAGVDLRTLIDHWVLPDTEALRAELTRCGFQNRLTMDADPVWAHTSARLARIRLSVDQVDPRIAIAVESISDFWDAWDLPAAGSRGDAESGYEEAHCALPVGELAAVVRIGYNGFRPGELSATYLRAIQSIRTKLRDRRTGLDSFESIDKTLRDLHTMLSGIVEEVGCDRATDEFFVAERAFYTERNRAATLQYRKQQELGIGWANQDHHTYRSSRAGFRGLLALWELLGFVPRERYYAGAEAGWGAQIMEHPVSRVVIFSDLDIGPSEVAIDFSSTELSQPDSNNSGLGTIGLWCALHGDSIAVAGMHHLECEFDFSAAVVSLNDSDVAVMPPFTDMPVLKQAFTAGELWPVEVARVQALAEQGFISAAQAQQFVSQGAIGSHLEILQRWDGFKGFNKTGVSDIIRATDARNAIRG